MKLVRYGPKGRERAGRIDGQGRVRDLSAHLKDLDGTQLSPAALRAIGSIDAESLPLVEGEPRLGPPIAAVGKFIAVGLNYREHVVESKAQLPTEPVVFMKATSCISGPYDDVIIPRGSTKTDWEVELGVVIGTTASYVTRDRALEYVAGYLAVHDVSERSFQLERQGTWDKGKGCDTFGPIGPWLVTADEIPDVQRLELWLDVNGERKQTGSTAEMVFGVATLVSYLSEFMSLQPGDVIATGTPPGVGMGQKPAAQYLKPGDVVRLGVESLGVQEQRFVAWEDYQRQPQVASQATGATR